MNTFMFKNTKKLNVLDCNSILSTKTFALLSLSHRKPTLIVKTTLFVKNISHAKHDNEHVTFLRHFSIFIMANKSYNNLTIFVTLI